MLAVRTGIPPTTWADEGEQTIRTAFEVLKAASSGADSEEPEEDAWPS